MKPAAFKYIPARSAEDAIEHFERYAGDARFLAGGQSLMPLINLRMAKPKALVDLGRCAELSYIRQEGHWLAIGPMTTQSQVESSNVVKECCPLVWETMGYLGSPTIRNRGTIGGTLAHADRIAELPGVAVALRAELVAQGPRGRRSIAAEDFFVADLTNALASDEMLREVRFPVASRSGRCAFSESSNRHHDLATVGIAVVSDLLDDVIRSIRIVAVGVGPTPVRLKAAERRLIGARPTTVSVSEASELAADEAKPEGDFHASAAYRHRVIGGLLDRALRRAHRLP